MNILLKKTKIFIGSSKILFPSILISILAILYLAFFKSATYKSEAIISIESNTSLGSAQIANSIGVGGLLSGNKGGSIEIYELGKYLKSDEFYNIFESQIDTEIISNKKIDFISRYRPEMGQSFKKYMPTIFSFIIDDASNTVTISTTGFDPRSSFMNNLIIIGLASSFFDRKKQSSANIARTQRLCDLLISQLGLIESTSLEISNVDIKDILANDLDSANRLLENKARLYSDNCLKNADEENVNIGTANNIAKSTFREVNSESQKQIIANIYNDSIDALTISDVVKIISEPQFPKTSEDKNIILNSTLAFLFSFFLFFSIQVLVRLREQFDT